MHCLDMKLMGSARRTVLGRILYTKGLRPSRTVIGRLQVIDLNVKHSDKGT